MKAQPLPLIGGFYADEARPWSQQDICNWLPVATESDGTRTPTMAKTPPGLSPFARISGEPVRGIYNAEGRLFTVSGNTLYQVTPTAAVELGAISGTGRVRFAHNQITGGNQVLVVNGSAGWVWNTLTSTLTQITDTGYPGAIDAVFIDGYLVQIEPARRYAFHSDLADALNYNTLDRFTSEVSPDLLVGMAVSNNELLLLSESTGEFFENTGASQQPFRSKRISFNKGCAGRYTIATMDNTVFWLGDDGVFYLLDGYSPKRISTRPIEQAIRGRNWAQAFAFVWEDSGHSVCYWTFLDGMTFGYDASQGKWHRRASYGFDRWRVNGMAYWQNQWIAGDFQKGRLWKLDWSYPLEYDQEFISELTGVVIHDNQSLVLMPRLEVIMDTGMPEVVVRDFEIDTVALSITGDLPNGTVGDSGTMQYIVAGGVPPLSAVTIASGSLPPGATMDSDGLVTYAYTASGSYAWEAQVVDADGNVATVADTANIQALEWIGSSLGGTSSDIVPSPDGMDWTATGWTVPNYSDGFLLRRPSDGAVVAYNAIVLSYKFGISLDNGATFSMYDTVGMNATGHIVGWSGGYWHCSSTSNATRVSDAGVQTSVASTTGFNTMCIADDRIIGFKSLRIWHADETGDNWADVLDMPFTSLVTTFRAKAHGSTVCLAAYADLGATLDLHVIWSDDNGDTFADTTPMSMADPAPSTAPCVWYDEVMGLWAVTLHNRVVFGPTPGALEEAAYTFPSAVNDVGSDGEKFVFACTGHIVTTSDFVTFTQVHASGAKSVLAYPVSAT